MLVPISKEDRAVVSLKSLMNDINEQIQSLETRIAACIENSRNAVEMKNRSSALAALRSKRSAESALSRRVETLFQLEEIYGKIEQASDQITMLRVMRGSTDVLRKLNAEVGSAEDVEDVLDGLKEEMGTVEDIGTAINQAGQETSAINEDEVDEELDALMRQSHSAQEEKAVEETKQRLADLEIAEASHANSAIHLDPYKHMASAAPHPAPDSATSKEVAAAKHVSVDEGSTVLANTKRLSSNYDLTALET